LLVTKLLFIFRISILTFIVPGAQDVQAGTELVFASSHHNIKKNCTK